MDEMNAVKNISEFIAKVTDYQNEFSNKEEVSFFYRGQSSAYGYGDSHFSVIPSLMHKENIEKSEYAVFQDILRLDTDAFSNQKSYLDIHKEMQHYCEISRVIDITTQALTGLFFAVGELTKDDCSANPCVFMFAVDKNKIKRPESDGTQLKLALSTIKDEQRAKLEEAITSFEQAVNEKVFEDDEELLSPIYLQRNDQAFLENSIRDLFRRNKQITFDETKDSLLVDYVIKTIQEGNFEKTINQIIRNYYLEDFNNQESVRKLSYAVRKNDGVFEELQVPKDIKDIEFVLPNMNNKRIIAQQGAFIAVGLLEKEEVYEIIKSYLELPDGSERIGFSDENLMMIKINRHYAYQIKLELESLGISKAVMYPDIQKIGSYLKNDLYAR